MAARFPFAGNEFVLMYYNTELCEQYNLEVPQTFDDLLTVVKTFNEAGITLIFIFAQEGWASAAMFVSGQWFISDADKNLPGKVDWFYFPTTDDGGDNQFAMSGSGTLGGYAVSASTPDKKLAANVAVSVCNLFPVSDRMDGVLLPEKQ